MTFNSRQPYRPFNGSLSKTYHFEHLKSGLHFHGGCLQVNNTAVHYHLNQPYIAFVILLKGSVRFALNKKSYVIDSDDVGRCVLIATKKITLFSRYLIQNETIEKLTISGVQQWLGDDYHLDDTIVRDWPLTSEHKQMAKQLLDADCSLLEKDALAMNVISTCWNNYGKPLFTANNQGEKYDSQRKQMIDAKNTKKNSRLALENAMLEALEDGAQEVVQIASHLNIPLRTLQRRVRTYCDCSINEWRQQVLMQKALTALGKDNLSIGETAYLCGYKQPSNFIQAFRKYYGVTPGALLTR